MTVRRLHVPLCMIQYVPLCMIQYVPLRMTQYVPTSTVTLPLENENRQCDTKISQILSALTEQHDEMSGKVMELYEKVDALDTENSNPSSRR
jgi:hypothetical protein